MFEQPTAAELVAAVRQHLEAHVLPTIGDARLRFQTLVAANVLGIVERELALGEGAQQAAYERVSALLGTPPEQLAGGALAQALANADTLLSEQIAAGQFDAAEREQALLAHLQQTARDELQIANPRFLQRVDSGSGPR